MAGGGVLGVLLGRIVPWRIAPLLAVLVLAAGQLLLYEVGGPGGASTVELLGPVVMPPAALPEPAALLRPATMHLIYLLGGTGLLAAAAALYSQITAQRLVVGVNIGKSKITPADVAVSDYSYSAKLLAPFADYLVVNVSSPNTPGLRDLQAVSSLAPILRGVQDAANHAAMREVPVLVKIAPDLADEDIAEVAHLVVG